MKIPISWLKEFVDINIPVEELAHRLTMAGLEVGEVITIGGWENCFVGYVEKVERHPNADRLTLPTVDLGGGESATVVCGAPNVAAGQKIAFAREGARLLSNRSGKIEPLKASKPRPIVPPEMCTVEPRLALKTLPTAPPEMFTVAPPLATKSDPTVPAMTLTTLPASVSNSSLSWPPSCRLSV